MDAATFENVYKKRLSYEHNRKNILQIPDKTEKNNAVDLTILFEYS